MRFGLFWCDGVAVDTAEAEDVVGSGGWFCG